MNAEHSGHLEAAMAYLDGQLPAEEAARVRAHMEACGVCRRMEGDLRDLSGRLQAWQVEPAPMSLTPPRGRWRARRLLFAAAAAVVLLVLGGMWMLPAVRSPLRPAVPSPATMITELGSSSEFSVARQTVADPLQGPLVIRTVRLAIVPTDFDAARAEIDRIVAHTGGFVGRIVANADGSRPRTLDATLRVPSPGLDETIDALKRLGHVSSEAHDGEDVTQQSADLDARLANARTSETRLREILERRTGNLTEVLAVERELARIRQDIESMEAQRKSLDQRVAYASVHVTLIEQRQAAVDLGPTPIGTRFRNAWMDGWAAAAGLALGAALGVVRIGPTLVLAALVLMLAVLVWRRHLRTLQRG